MKTQLSLLLCSVVLSASASVANSQDLFPDKALEAAVRHEVFAKRYNEEPLTKEDVRTISQVHAKGKGIKSLEGLQYCVAVQEIDLEDNEIIDLKPIAGLKLIQSLNLAGNKISDIEPLKELERIQYLELSRNTVEEISALAKMTNMRSLYLSDNYIRRIGVVRSLPKVWTLYLARNPVKNFAPIGNLKWLSSLDLERTQVEDLSFLSPLTELKYVNLKNNRIATLEPLVKMANGDEQRRFSPFWKLYLKSNPLADEAEKQMEELSKLGARIKMD